jgi:hypothetical protein
MVILLMLKTSRFAAALSELLGKTFNAFFDSSILTLTFPGGK